MEHFRRLGIADELRSEGLPPDVARASAYVTRFCGHEFGRLPRPYSDWPTPEIPNNVSQIVLERVLRRCAERAPRRADPFRLAAAIVRRARRPRRRRRRGHPDRRARADQGALSPRHRRRRQHGAPRARLRHDRRGRHHPPRLHGRHHAVVLHPLADADGGEPAAADQHDLDHQSRHARHDVFPGRARDLGRALPGAAGHGLARGRRPRGDRGDDRRRRAVRDHLRRAVDRRARAGRRALSVRPRVPGRRRRASVHAARRARHEHRHRRRDESRAGSSPPCIRAGPARGCSTATRSSGGRSACATSQLGVRCTRSDGRLDAAAEASRTTAPAPRPRGAPSARGSSRRTGRNISPSASSSASATKTRRSSGPTATTAPPDSWDTYTPLDRPGARAPHFWLAPRRAAFDEFGKGFTLLDFGAPEAAGAIEAAARTRGVPLKVLRLQPPDELYRSKLVLVRPDQHIAWHGDAVADPTRRDRPRARGVTLHGRHRRLPSAGSERPCASGYRVPGLQRKTCEARYYVDLSCGPGSRILLALCARSSEPRDSKSIRP